jgi:glucosamine--fructose-6-phosphate aminotransferase (isomerizing)
MTLHNEIHEQATVLARLLHEGRAAIEVAAEAIRKAHIEHVLLAARGTSSHAGVYAQYVWGMHNGLNVSLAAPSMFTAYQRPPRLRNTLVVGISQSGRSPDIVAPLLEGRRQGALTLAISNAANSPLAQAADVSLDVLAGEERAVAATKSYTAQLMTIALLSAALAADEQRFIELAAVPDAVATVLAREDEIRALAEHYRTIERCIVLARGYNFATALEWALKLKELAYVAADPYSSAEFQHGPIALADATLPIFAIAPHDSAVFADQLALLHRLQHEKHAERLVLSDDATARSAADRAFALPADVPAWLSPIVAIVPGQLFAYHLTQLKGHDPQQPRGLSKVTLTQ